MMWDRYVALKQKVGGNREKADFEFTFGATKEEQARVTQEPKHIVRALSQLEFALKLSEKSGGQFDGKTDEALTLLEKNMALEGTLTKSACEKAEEILLPLSPAAKEYEVLLCGHAHIDMNWMWAYEETVAATIATFRTVLTLMKDYPAFTFSQSQASVYKIIEEYDPEMKKEIELRIREGRWEVTAGAWVECDKNMPDTESLLRHIEYTKEYMRDNWGVNPDELQIDFSPDTFGHSAFLPEIDSYAGLKYYYHCRGLTTKETVYRWRAQNGAELIGYREPYWYNSGITPHIGLGAIAVSKYMKTSLIVYGVGDHGGGPTRRDVEAALDMATWPVFPTITFSSFREYFKRAEKVRESLPLIEGEMNYLMSGCYTTQSRIKRANRVAEAALNDAEAISAASGKGFDEAQLQDAWRKVLFNHFHDILPGSCTPESREYALGITQEALARAQTVYSKAALDIAQRTDTSCFGGEDDIALTQSEGAGAGYGVKFSDGFPKAELGAGKTRVYHLFNSLAFAREENVELTLWDWNYDLARVRVRDSKGNDVPFTLLDNKQQWYWDHRFVRILVSVKLPSLGYTTIAVDEKEASSYVTHRLDDERTEMEKGEITLENEHVRAVLSADGAITSFFDKEAGCERLGGRAKLCVIKTENSTCDAWNIGRYMGYEEMETIKLRHSASPLRSVVRLSLRALQSTAEVEISLDKNAKALKLACKVEWNEFAVEDAPDPSPLLCLRAPLKEKTAFMRMDVPGGSQDRAPAALDKPGLTHASAIYGERAFSMITDSKYAYRLWDDTFYSILINTASHPDPYPERGTHKITIWLAAGCACEKALREQALALIRAPHALSLKPHKGDLKPEGSFLNVESDTCVVSAVGRTKDGEMYVRLFETCGKSGEAALSLPEKMKKAELIGMDGRTLGKVKVEDGKAVVPFTPCAIQTVKLTV